MRAISLGTLLLFAKAISAMAFTARDTAGRQAVAIAGVESNFDNDVTSADLAKLYTNHAADQAATSTSFSFRKGGIVLAGYYYVQGSNDVKSAIDDCSNAGSASGTLTCLNTVLRAFIGNGLALLAGGHAGDTITEMISAVSTYALGLPIPPDGAGVPGAKMMSRDGAHLACPAKSTPWNTPGNVNFNGGWATTATVVRGCGTWSDDLASAAQDLALSLAVDMEFLGGSRLQFTIFNEQTQYVLMRSNLVVINGGDLCTAEVTGGGCTF